MSTAERNPAHAVSVVETENTPSVNASDGVTAGVAEQLRLVRRQRGLTLAQVASATSISTSFLSLLEAGKSDITIGRLMRLVHFYGISITDLLPSSDGADPVGVTRRENQKMFVSPSEGIKDYLLAPDTKRTMLPLLATFERGGKNVEPAEHEGEEFVHILDGNLTVEIAGHDPVVLRKGDSLYFAADMPHSYANTGSGVTRALFVVTPPHF
jgi:transcriptional regulator with XRE-family HTH domain